MGLSAAAVLVRGVSFFSDAAGRENSLGAAGAGDDGVDFVAAIDQDKIRHDRRSSIREIDGEGSRAIGVYGVGPIRRSVGKVRDDISGDGDGVDLSESAVAVKLCHGDSNLLTGKAESPELRTLDREAVVTRERFVRTCGGGDRSGSDGAEAEDRCDGQSCDSTFIHGLLLFVSQFYW